MAEDNKLQKQAFSSLARGRNIIYVQNIILSCKSHHSSNNVGKRRNNRDGDILNLPSFTTIAGDGIRVGSIVRLVNGAAKVFVRSREFDGDVLPVLHFSGRRA
jgi:hypothetical protein